MNESLSLGEYVRRLRRERRWTLYEAAERCDLSYTHLSRIENDSTLPKADTVVRLSVALGGDLVTMLEKANCLPAVILEQMAQTGVHDAPTPLKRAAFHRSSQHAADPDQTVRVLAGIAALNDDQLEELASTVTQLARLPEQQRSMVSKFILSLGMELADESAE